MSDSLRKYQEDDVLDIKCEILTEVSEVKNAYKCNTCDLQCLFDDIKKLFNKERFNDAIFNVNGGKFMANKLILSALPDVLRKQFKLKDTTPFEFDLPSIDENVMKLFLSYLYSGNLELLALHGPIPIGMYEYTIALSNLEKL
ncbi:hypothetical protein AVEN_228751-1 [Araneus ventricosus]|uniref:BTB domain-containing protein n=1 Tax=Araneus ventricosus TaxID=182803 RepID=A0A4Y2GLE3_ARAVE|nr:hypothetical protein AVEN_228751-1 [Araneus ventricosus]